MIIQIPARGVIHMWSCRGLLDESAPSLLTAIVRPAAIWAGKLRSMTFFS